MIQEETKVIGEVLLDTSILIDHLRSTNKSNTFLIQVLSSCTYAYISVLTIAELYSGKSIWVNEVAKKEVDILTSDLNKLGLSESVCKFAGHLRNQFNMGIVDALIAATCYEHKLQLATLDNDLLQTDLGIPILQFKGK